MWPLYKSVRLATLIYTGILLLFAISLLVQLFLKTPVVAAEVVPMVVYICLFFLGAWGSFKHNIIYLIVFAVAMSIAIVASCIAGFEIVQVLMSLVLVALVLTQAELIRRGQSDE